MKSKRFYLLLNTLVMLAFALLASGLPGASAGYDPLTLADVSPPQPLDLTVHDPSRQRDIPVRVYLPAAKSAAPVILFSHGLGGSREGYAYLGTHWAGRGYVAVHLQHHGSDDGVWRGLPPLKAMAAMRKAANIDNFLLRNQDVAAVLDQLDLWNKEAGNPLSGRLDLAHVGMAGHSFGAVTTQAVSGERFSIGADRYNDARIKASIMMSPSLPTVGDAQSAFGSVGIPWMLMTGTNDAAPIGNATAQSRLAVYEALPPGRKYEMVLDGAEHSAFSDRALPGDRQPRDPAHHRAILAMSTAFWDACLRGDDDARRWLDGEGPRSVLAKSDVWKRK